MPQRPSDPLPDPRLNALARTVGGLLAERWLKLQSNSPAHKPDSAGADLPKLNANPVRKRDSAEDENPSR